MSESQAPEPASSPVKPNWKRGLAAITVATLVGGYMSCAGSSVWHVASNDPSSKIWGLVVWGDHWALRMVASLLGFAAAGFIAGAVARKHARFLALIGVMPYLACWISILAVWLVASDNYYFPVGYRFASILLLLVAPYITIKAAKHGEIFGLRYSCHFDTRRHSVLGIAWYHYLWAPLYGWFLYLALAPLALSIGLAVRNFLRTRGTFIAIIPIMMGVGWSLLAMLCVNDAGSAYMQLAGFPEAKRSPHILIRLFRGPLLAMLIFVILAALMLHSCRGGK